MHFSSSGAFSNALPLSAGLHDDIYFGRHPIPVIEQEGTSTPVLTAFFPVRYSVVQ